MERKINADRKNLQLYAITDSHWLNGRTLYSVVKESLEGGLTFLQLREKELDEEHFLEEARELQKLCREYQVPFVINDNVDIAAAINADGVHVGQSDMEAGDVRAKLGPDKIIGVTAKTVEQAVLAQERGADYLGVGAVFHTDSKADAKEISFDTLKDICRAVSIPVIAKPNAGMPVIDDQGNAVYSMNPADFAKHMQVLVENGAGIIGGCCGTTPDFIREMKKLLG